MNDMFYKNMRFIKLRFPEIAIRLEKTQAGKFYAGTEISKTGKAVPFFSNGNAVHSKYNPEKEAEKIFGGEEDFVLFCGIGGGFYIEYFLNNFKNKICAAFEYDYSSLRNIIELCDLSGILKNENFILLPPVSSKEFVNSFTASYIPVLYGSFSVKILRSWENFFYGSANREINRISFLEKINESLDIIKADVSTQACFGKIWLRNIFRNLKTASEIYPEIPKTYTEKTALILGAGPGLEFVLQKIRQNRNDFVLFACDTAFRVLADNKIEADFFVSVDPQAVSFMHCTMPFSKHTVGIFDLCANPLCVRLFAENGNNFFFVSGTHPLTQYAASFSAFPILDTSAGTVAAAALDAAKKLSFKNIGFAGLDFAYTNGKAYASGSYLSKMFITEAVKTKTEETFFADLMFRTETKAICGFSPAQDFCFEKYSANNFEAAKSFAQNYFAFAENSDCGSCSGKTDIPSLQKNKAEGYGGITYTTKLLDGYKKLFFESLIRENKILWQKKDFAKFGYDSFLNNLKEKVRNKDRKIIPAFLPFFMWKYKTINRKVIKEKLFFEIELVLKEVLSYNTAK